MAFFLLESRFCLVLSTPSLSYITHSLPRSPTSSRELYRHGRPKAMADFNSSDIEFDEPEPRFPNLARNAIAKIVEDAASARIQSKKTVKNLQLTTSPGVDYARAGWENKFEAFCTNTLRHKPGQVPDPEAILRFFSALPDYVHNRRRNEDTTAVTIGHFEQGLRHILNLLCFKHADFSKTLGKSFALRAQSLFNQLVHDGKISKSPTREKQRIGVHTMLEMNVGLFRQGLKDSYSWDVTIQRLATLACQTAFASRAGDFMKSPHWDGQHTMKWKHLEFKLTKDDLLGELLEGVFTLTNCKGDKDDQYHNESVRVSSTKAEHSLLCPLRLLVSLAIRTRQVVPTTAADLFQQLRTSRSGRVVWSNPEAPVFVQIGRRSASLVPDTTAPAAQVLDTLRKAADIAGFTCLPVTHDIRRGSAKEISKLKDAEVPNLQLAGQAIFHKARSTNLGTTKEYTGGLDYDHHNARLEQAPATYKFGAPKRAPASYKPVGRLPQEQITQLCEQYLLDPAKQQDRAKAAEWFKKDHRRKWAEEQDAKMDQPIAEEDEGDSDAVDVLPEVPDVLTNSDDVQASVDYFASLADRKRRRRATAVAGPLKKPRSAGNGEDSLGSRKKCPECAFTKGDFLSKKRLRDHLQKMHGKSEEDAARIVLTLTDPSFVVDGAEENSDDEDEVTLPVRSKPAPRNQKASVSKTISTAKSKITASLAVAVDLDVVQNPSLVEAPSQRASRRAKSNAITALKVNTDIHGVEATANVNPFSEELDDDDWYPFD